jgi:formate hydrogenlyase subunit 4
MMGAIALVPHMALMLAAAPLLAGLLGPGSPAQPWRDLRRLFRKPGIWPEAAGPFAAAPVVMLGATLAAAVLVPSFTLGMATAPMSDLVLIAMLFGLSRAAVVLAAFDAGTGTASLASMRVAVLGATALPGLLVPVLVLAAATGTSLLDPAIAALRESGVHPALALAATAAAITCVALDDAGPEPDFAGRDLAVVTFAGQLRYVTVLSLLAALALPFGLAQAEGGLDTWLVGAACWAVKMGVLAVAAGALRRLRAGLRAERVPELALLGLIVALIAAALFLAGQGAA